MCIRDSIIAPFLVSVNSFFRLVKNILFWGWNSVSQSLKYKHCRHTSADRVVRNNSFGIKQGILSMEIKGIQKVTLLDYPGKVACTVFTGGCNFRCPFCQNSDLVISPALTPTIAGEEIFGFLRKRRGLLDAICISCLLYTSCFRLDVLS